MLKTNSKQAKEAYRRDFADLCMAYATDEAETEEEALRCVYRDFESMLYKGEGITEGWQRFLMGSGLGFYAYCDMRDYLKNLLKETDEEAERFDDDQVLFQYCYTLFKAFVDACHKYGLNPYIIKH